MYIIIWICVFTYFKQSVKLLEPCSKGQRWKCARSTYVRLCGITFRLGETYRKRTGLREFVRMMFGLQFLPVEHIAGAFDRLRHRAMADFTRQFALYFANQWMTNPVFRIEDWCVFRKWLLKPSMTISADKYFQTGIWPLNSEFSATNRPFYSQNVLQKTEMLVTMHSFISKTNNRHMHSALPINPGHRFIDDL